jgi:hypothetical protein
MVVLRDFGDLKATTGLLKAGHPVFIVIRTPDTDLQRIMDLLAGWALGSDGELDRISPNTVLALPPGSVPVRLGRSGITSAVEEVFTSDDSIPMSREEEERLVPLAIAGSVSARRRLIDTYAELATLFALRIRPKAVSEAAAVGAAQEELDRLVSFPSQGPLLASLVDGIAKRLIH